MRIPDISFAFLLTVLLLNGCSSDVKKQEKATAKATATAKEETLSLQPYLKEAAQQSASANDYPAAAAHWGAIYDEDPSNVQAAVNFAVNLRYIGGPREAIIILDKALAAHPDDPLLLTERSKAHTAAGDLELALADIERALKAPVKIWSTYSTHGVILDRQGHQAEAEVAYQKALELSPGNPKILNNMALSLAMAGRLDEAISTLRRAAQHVESTVQIRQNLSLLLAMKGETDEAGELARADLPAAISANNIAYFQSLNEAAAN